MRPRDFCPPQRHEEHKEIVKQCVVGKAVLRGFFHHKGKGHEADHGVCHSVTQGSSQDFFTTESQRTQRRSGAVSHYDTKCVPETCK